MAENLGSQWNPEMWNTKPHGIWYKLWHLSNHSQIKGYMILQDFCALINYNSEAGGSQHKVHNNCTITKEICLWLQMFQIRQLITHVQQSSLCLHLPKCKMANISETSRKILHHFREDLMGILKEAPKLSGSTISNRTRYPSSFVLKLPLWTRCSQWQILLLLS